MTKRWIPTYCGQIVDLLDPQPETLWAEDAIHALSRVVRCAAHVGRAGMDYCVADHSVFVADILAGQPAHVQFAGLLHDATEETWIGDLTSPFKMALCDEADAYSDVGEDHAEVVRGALRRITERFEAAARVAFHIPELTPNQERSIKDADLLALVSEQFEFFQWTPQWQSSADNCGRPALPERTGLRPRALLKTMPFEREAQFRKAWHYHAAVCGHLEGEKLDLDGESICARCGRALGALKPLRPLGGRRLSKVSHWHQAANASIFRLCGECAGPAAYLIPQDQP